MLNRTQGPQHTSELMESTVCKSGRQIKYTSSCYLNETETGEFYRGSFMARNFTAFPATFNVSGLGAVAALKVIHVCRIHTISASPVVFAFLYAISPIFMRFQFMQYTTSSVVALLPRWATQMGHPLGAAGPRTPLLHH